MSTAATCATCATWHDGRCPYRPRTADLFKLCIAAPTCRYWRPTLWPAS